MIALATKQLSKHFLGVWALKDLSIQIEKGTVTGLIGPNGSGKSTLLQILCGLTAISEGAVVISDHHLQRVKPHKLSQYGIARTFQDGRLIGQMSVLDNLLLAISQRHPLAALREFKTKTRLDQARHMLEQIDLWEKRHDLVEELSYGQRKLLEMMRAIALGADTYLLDEPFSGLFPKAIETFVGLIEGLKAQGKTVVLVDHNMALIERLCSHVIVLDAGRLLTQGPPIQVLNDPKVLEAYLGE